MTEAPERFMRLALREAAKGLGRTRPNPPVGVVLVKAGRVVARGHHARAGGPHAEVVALRAAGAAARGADLYTTLEPCDHYGKTPPCSLAILEAGVRRVLVGSRDPNQKGRGVRRLRRAGVEVVEDVARADCDALVAPWLRFIATGRPFVTLKAAVTLDGKVATRTGDARWVTGEEARREVHRLRDQVDAVLVGAGTARTDDPLLTARLPGGRGHDPVRVVLDSRLRLPPTLRMFAVASAAPALVATAARGGARRLARAGVTVLRCEAGADGRVDLDDLLARLGALGLTHLLVEGGPEVHAAFLAAGLVDRVVVHVAPKLLGGGRDWLAGPGPARIADALRLVEVSVRRLGDDLEVTGRPAPAASGRRPAATGRSAARARPARAPRAARRPRA